MTTKRVLVADDDLATRHALLELLRELGIEAAEAADGLDAVNQLRAGQYDLAIVDLVMPRLDGYVVIRYLEEQRPETRAIVLSGVRDEELRDVARSSVVTSVMAKPLEAADLASKIRASLDGPAPPPRPRL